MRKISYYTLDVFTDKFFGGNPLAVFTDALDVREEEMQSIARELNLSETTFVLPADDDISDFKVRIFTPGQELPMAGHPTLGTAYIMSREKNYLPEDTQLEMTLQEGIGPINVEISLRNGQPDKVYMEQRVPKFGQQFEDRSLFADLLSLEAQELMDQVPVAIVDCGLPYLLIPVKTLKSVQQIQFRIDIWEKLRHEFNLPFVYIFCLETVHPDAHVHGRMFAPEAGVLEDPATGSANGPLGCYLVEHQLIPCHGKTIIKSEQGHSLERPSEIMIEIYGEPGAITKVKVGGSCILVGQGQLYLDQ